MSSSRRKYRKQIEGNFVCPKRGTRSAEAFYQSWNQTNGFYDFLHHLVDRADVAAETAQELLLQIENDEAKRQELISGWKQRVSAEETLRQNEQFFLEIIFVRHVENFLSYLSSLLYEIFTQRPETLRSGDKVEVASLLHHDSIESIVRDLAERKVESLSYSSFGDLVKFFSERFKLVLGGSEEVRQVGHAIEIRNISVHNRCIIDKRFANRVGLTSDHLGRRYDLRYKDLFGLAPTLARRVKAIDYTASSKLRLRGVRFSREK